MPVARRVRNGFSAVIWSSLVVSVLTFYAVASLTSVLHGINTYDVSSMQLSGEISKKIYQTTSNVYQTMAGMGRIERPADQLNEVKMLLGSMRQLLSGRAGASEREVLLTLTTSMSRLGSTRTFWCKCSMRPIRTSCTCF